MSAKSISEKVNQTIAPEHIVHASKMNVTLIRTIDLLQIIKLNEINQTPISILEISKKGGGLIVVNDNNCELLKE